MKKPVIVTKNLMKTYDSATNALDGVDITIKKGEWCTIIGPSGSGKTTLLNMISCLDYSTSGSIMVNNVDVTGLNQKELTQFRRENIGLIFQQYHMIPYLSALENVMLAQYFHSIVDEKDAIEALERVGMGHRLKHIPAHLSGGEQQRVCIARALINDPKILLADEPTGNLDMKNGQIVLDLIKQLNDGGHTIIIVTHNQKIAKLGTKTIKLVDGKIANGNVNKYH